MKDAHAPTWLAALQADWTALLRAPLDSSSGTFREVRRLYPTALRAGVTTTYGAGSPASPDDRLALYHQQYWMRLFTTLQSRFPRLAFALGYWHFNHLALRHLTTRPPCHFDIDQAGEGFAERVRCALRDLGARRGKSDVWMHRLTASRAPITLLTEALRLDEVEREVYDAAFEPSWQPTAEQLQRLVELRIRRAASLRLVEESWDLVRLSSLTSDVTTTPNGPPQRLAERRYWALHRTEWGTESLQVPRAFARLLEAASEKPFGVALAELEEQSTPDELHVVRAGLAEWVQTAVKRGLWVGVEL